MALDSVWLCVQQDYGDFDVAREAFLWLLERFLENGIIKMGKRGLVSEDDEKKIVRRFRESFPTSEAELENNTGLAIWFFSDDCPGGAIWMDDVGNEIWT
ncbi:DUF596 domain-containing protein [Cupriavidus sp. UME77]|uniref:DUF596 domain-containing protein n=1 Tax=Cupriavidus sp. UME77 TaxID=1862321 RepID=UPI0016026FDB|nr:hypothetical protein [Cupriavidus sp. UME77]